MIEIKGFLETSFVDWPGKLCSVLFLPYCNFRCPFCHNHPLVLHPEGIPSISLGDVLDRLSSFRDWIDGVCLSGGEPTLERNLPRLVYALKEMGFSVKLDTNGSNPDLLERLLREKALDFVSMDVKAPLDASHYRRAAGVSVDLNSILRSIELLKGGKVDYEFRMTAVPTLHSEEDIKRVGQGLRAGRRFVLQNFNSENPLDPSLRGITPFDPNLLKAIEREVQAVL